jgi:methionine aminopeptidase
MYTKVQKIAKETIEHLSKKITSGMSEKEIADISNEFMKSKGVQSFWYHGVGSLVLVGKRTLISISGRDYYPSNEKVKDVDLVTIDLSPELNGCWGDYARSFTIENGKVVTNPKNKILAEGIQAEDKIHEFFINTITPDMEFGDAFNILNKKIKEMGFINLDFLGNLGHSIEKNIDDRIYVPIKEERHWLQPVDEFR